MIEVNLHMIEIETYFAMPKKFIEENLNEYSEMNFYNYPDICYVSIKEEDKVSCLVQNKEIEINYLDVCILIKYNKEVIMGYDIHGLNLWDDFYETLNYLLNDLGCSVHLGIEPILLNITLINKDDIKLDIVDDFRPDRIYYSNVLNKIELIKGLIYGGINFYSNLLNYVTLNKEILEGKLKDFYNFKMIFDDRFENK